MRTKNSVAISNSMLIVIVLVVVLLGASLVYFGGLLGPMSSTTSSSSSSSSVQSTIKGIVAGTVTVGPSQPACNANQSCTVDMTGYSLEFTSRCGGTGNVTSSTSCQAQTYSAPISPSGHYSVLLAPGDYSITGLSPSCSWPGCSSAFPKTVTVEPGNQLTVNIDVDTGIR